MACLKTKLIITSKKVLFTHKQYNGLKKLRSDCCNCYGPIIIAIS